MTVRVVLSNLLHDHDPGLLALAVTICLIGSAAGVLFWSRSLRSGGQSRYDWIFLSSVILGGSVWTTHFVAMLGYSDSAVAEFDFLLTALSIAIAILGIGMSVTLTSLWRGRGAVLAAGTTLGCSIALMHFVGMIGYRTSAPMTWDVLWSPLALLIGVVFGIATVALFQRETGGRAAPRLAALTFAAAVAGVHFTAMAAYHARMPALLLPAEVIDHTTLALAVTLVTCLIVGMSVSGYLIQDRLSKAASHQLEISANTDPLTNLANRGAFNRHLEIACEEMARGGPSFALLSVDLDRFKAVNDAFGHHVGDETLRRVVGRLKSACNPGDVIARLGGDEFAIILHDVTPHDEQTEFIADCIVDLMARPFLVGTHLIEIGVSVGIAETEPGEVPDPDMMIRAADMALYVAKSEGRGNWKRFEAWIAEQFEQRRQLEHDLRRAIARNEFELFFQPVVHSANGSFKGAEALIRWRHPTRGILAPGAFIAIAEELGLVIQIGCWVVQEACRIAARWPDPLIVSVNLSPVQLKDGRIVQVVSEALAASGLPPHRLDLEITETALLSNEALGISVLCKLRGLGVSLSLDDFGTGFSSLSHLHKFPLDRIKIDRSFVQNVETDPRSAKIVQAISNLGGVLELSVTAEGVETEAQYNFIRDLGCDAIQGYLVSRPVPVAEVEARFAARSPFGTPLARTGT